MVRNCDIRNAMEEMSVLLLVTQELDDRRNDSEAKLWDYYLDLHHGSENYYIMEAFDVVSLS